MQAAEIEPQIAMGWLRVEYIRQRVGFNQDHEDGGRISPLHPADTRTQLKGVLPWTIAEFDEVPDIRCRKAHISVGGAVIDFHFT